jgi:hypothetical protein
MWKHEQLDGGSHMYLTARSRSLDTQIPGLTHHGLQRKRALQSQLTKHLPFNCQVDGCRDRLSLSVLTGLSQLPETLTVWFFFPGAAIFEALFQGETINNDTDSECRAVDNECAELFIRVLA